MLSVRPGRTRDDGDPSHAIAVVPAMDFFISLSPLNSPTGRETETDDPRETWPANPPARWSLVELAAALLCLDAQLLERLGAIVAVGGGLDLFVDFQNLAVFADVKCPPMREGPKGGHHAVGLGGGFGGVAEDGVVRLNRLGEVDVALLAVSGIATGGEVGDVEFSQLFAARTERLALERSAPGKCLGKPGDHHRLFAFVIGELVGVAIAALEREVRGGIADLEVRRAEVRGEDAGGENCREDECYFHFQFVWLKV